MTFAPPAAGRVVLLSNATSSVGGGLAAEFARDGARILLAGHDVDRLHAISARVAAAGGRPTIIYRDRISDGDGSELISYTMRLYHRLDVLVTELCDGADRVAASTTEDAWRVIDDQFSTMLDLVLLALPHMQRAGTGSIINIAAVAPPRDAAPGGVYWASRFLVRALSGAVRRHLRDGSIEIAAVYRSLARAGYAPRPRSWQTFVTLDSYDFDTGDDVPDPDARWIHVHGALPTEPRHETRSPPTCSRIAWGAARGAGKGRNGY